MPLDLRKKLSQERKGKRPYTITEETRKKMSESSPKQRAPLSESTKEKIAEAHRGKKQSEETKALLREQRGGDKNNAYGKRWVTDGVTSILASSEKVEELLAAGWQFGTSNKPTSGKKWWHNSTEEGFFSEPPDGWVMGRLKK